jgi:hypothetical protein
MCEGCYKNVKEDLSGPYLKVVVKSAMKAKLNVVGVVWLNSTLPGRDAVSIGFRGHCGEVCAFVFTARTDQLLYVHGTYSPVTSCSRHVQSSYFPINTALHYSNSGTFAI